MNNKLFKRVSIIAALILAILVISQGIWLKEQFKKEKQTFTSRLENSFQSIINFHALQGYSTQNPIKPNIATVSMQETPKRNLSKKDSSELGRSEINTKNFIPNFAIGKLIEASFINKSLSKGNFKLKTIDSLFICNFNAYNKIQNYHLHIINKSDTTSSIIHGELKNNSLKKSLQFIQLQLPLGTQKNFIFTADIQLKNFPFLQQFVLSISISALAVILVAFFILWLLWTLHQQIVQLQWREKAVSGIVHDLKSPLSYVYTFLDYLSCKSDGSDTQEQLLNANFNISKLTDKMEVLLTLFRSKKRKITMQYAPYNLNQKCQEILSELEVIYQSKQIKHTVNISSNLNIKVDSLYFDSAIRNLIDNALKYSKTKAELNLFTISKQKELHIGIKDSGIGIPQKEQKKIFQEFYRSNEVTKGHGIGLAFAQQIIKAHKGRIYLESEVGKGSTFYIVLPIKLIAKL